MNTGLLIPGNKIESDFIFYNFQNKFLKSQPTLENHYWAKNNFHLKKVFFFFSELIYLNQTNFISNKI